MKTLLDKVKRKFDYDAETGVLTVKKTGKTPCVSSRGYLVVNVASRMMPAHRVAWLMVYGELPDGQLDHANGVKTDNRISNLRLASAQENNANRRGWKKSLTGIKGVSLKNGRPFAQIMVNGSNKYLGSFATVDEASDAYRAAALQHFGEFARS